jgi:hypothetical protein
MSWEVIFNRPVGRCALVQPPGRFCLEEVKRFRVKIRCILYRTTKCTCVRVCVTIFYVTEKKSG